ncbi:hypothetical protein BKN37_13755 [Mycobacterium talmoniae]|uniref:SSD domain-containing protein n=1 Tax=Mycobacterium talmoniae TaxID=1858794 RepID=A0A1S1NKG3_9MYCO|nr:hypothetical protein BKN37_13755 [Mycobacterium talmoniae]
MIDQLSALATRAPKVTLAVAAVVFVLCGLSATQLVDRLSLGGAINPDAESSRANAILASDFGVSGMQLILAVESPDGVGGVPAERRAMPIVEGLRSDSRVRTVVSAWNDPQLRARLSDRDGRVGLIVANVIGDDNQAQKIAADLSARYVGTTDGVTVTAGGQAMLLSEINTRAPRDVALVEPIAMAVTFLLLVWFLRSALAAMIPVLVGGLAIAATTAVLFVLSLVMDLSVFALNIATMLGLALAIDYSLLIIARYREEIAQGTDQSTAIAVAMRTGGRAVLFSGLTVAISMVGMTFFPMVFLRSLGYAGIAVVVLSILLTLICVPALLAVFGERINRKPLREAAAPESRPLYRVAVVVQRHPALVGLSVLAVLLVLGVPFLGVRLGLPDDRVLPTSVQSRQVGDMIRQHFADNPTGTVPIVLRHVGTADQWTVGNYAKQLSAVADVDLVVAPTGSYAHGHARGPGDPHFTSGDTMRLQVSTHVDPYSTAGQRLLTELRALPAPAPTLFSGLAQQNRDTAKGIVTAFPKTLAWIALTTFVLLLLLTGSVVLPLKALVMNTLSLTTTFGALVWIFQDGHLGGLGTSGAGYTVAYVPVLLFCFAFGLSMDYEVFLLSRFAEEWEHSGRTRADNDRAVALGLARSGPVVTAAAVLMAVVFAGVAVSSILVLRMLGLGMMMAVLIDATVIRTLLVPAFMRVAGTWNWWAPRWFRPALAKVRVRH